MTPTGVAEAARDWGEDSPLYQIRVLGEFPSAASHQLVRYEWIEQAADAPAAGGGFALGVDVARSGEDETAAVLLEGNRLTRLQRWLGQNTMRTVGEIKGLVDELGEVAVAVDDGGVGGGVVDRLRELDVRVYGGQVRRVAGRQVVGPLQEQAGRDVLAAAGAAGGGHAPSPPRARRCRRAASSRCSSRRSSGRSRATG